MGLSLQFLAFHVVYKRRKINKTIAGENIECPIIADKKMSNILCYGKFGDGIRYKFGVCQIKGIMVVGCQLMRFL